MVELEISTVEEETPIVADPEVDFTVDQIIASRIIALIDESSDIITIDFTTIESIFSGIVDVNTIKRLTKVSNLEERIVNALNMLDEESKSTAVSSKFLNIAKTLFSNTEIDYFRTFEGDE